MFQHNSEVLSVTFSSPRGMNDVPRGWAHRNSLLLEQSGHRSAPAGWAVLSHGQRCKSGDLCLEVVARSPLALFISGVIPHCYPAWSKEGVCQEAGRADRETISKCQLS